MASQSVWSFKFGVGIAALLLAAGAINAAPVAYEPFDYPIQGAGAAGDNELNGLNGGTGWSGAWVSSDDGSGPQSIEVLSGGLSFGSLPVEGNHAGRIGVNNRAVASRTISGSSHLADGTTLWFSVLFRDGGVISGTQNDDFAFTFGTGTHVPSSGADPGFAAAGDAFGFADIAGDISAIEHVNATAQTLSSSSLADNDKTFLLAGKINWKASGASDEFFLFNITDPAGAEPAEGAAFASHLADFDQSAFNTLSMWDRPNAAARIDEIRFATTFNEVMGVPEPSTMALAGLGLLGFAALAWRRRRG